MYIILQFNTAACPSGTYKDERILGDESTCKKCPDENQSTALGSTHLSQCSCKKGFRAFNGTGCSGEFKSISYLTHSEDTSQIILKMINFGFQNELYVIQVNITFALYLVLIMYA
jgi:hypothetical protein